MKEIERADLYEDKNSNLLYDRLCIVLILFIIFSSVINWGSLYPNPVDSYYHMAVIRAFSDSGGLVLHDYWEFAPAGRPHLYAPTIHIIGFVLSSLGLSMSAIGKLMSWLPYPLSFLVMWLWLRNAIGARGAFFSLVLLAGPADWFFSQTAHWANVFVLIMAPLAFLSFEKHKYFIATVFSILACYAHGSGLLVPAAILLYGIHRPSLLKQAIISSSISVAAFLPWLIHVYANRNLVTTARPSFFQIEDFRLFVVLMPLAVAGIVLAYKRRGNTLILPCFLFSFAVMFPMGYAHRFWQFNSIMPYAALAGFALAAFADWTEKRFRRQEYGFVITITVLLVGITLNPVISFGRRGMPMPPMAQGMQPAAKDTLGMPKEMPANAQRRARMGNMAQGQTGLRFEQTAIARMLSGSSGGQMGGSSMNSDEMTAMVNLIEEHAGKDDIVAANVGPMNSCLIPAMTGIRITDGMLREVHSEESQPRFEGASIAVLQDRNSAGNMRAPGPPGPMMRMDEKSLPAGFEFVAESDGIRLFKNTKASKSDFTRQEPVLTPPLIILTIIGMGGLTTLDLLKKRLSKKMIIAGISACIVICATSLTPLTIAAILELSNQPERPAGIDNAPPFMEGMQGMHFEGFKDLPPIIARKHSELMRSVQEEIRKGNLPDYFLPRDVGIEIQNLLSQRKFADAEQLIDDALAKRQRANEPDSNVDKKTVPR